MIKLTVVYNLPPDANREEFIRWRTTAHQQQNASLPGLIKTDFYVIESAWRTADPPYHYMTEFYFPDMATFEKSFYDPEYQVKLAKSMERIIDPLFLISNEVLTEVIRPELTKAEH